MFQYQIKTEKGSSWYRIEDTGKVRLIVQPQDRSILIGHLSSLDTDPTREDGQAILILQKRDSSFQAKSFSLGIPRELYDYFPGIQTFVIQPRDTGKLYSVTRAMVKMFGYGEQSHLNHNYIYVDFEYWQEKQQIEDLISVGQKLPSEAPNSPL